VENVKEKYWVIEQENISPKNRAAANEYLLDQKLAGKSVTTIDKYRMTLEGFLTECPKDIDQMVADDVHDWLRDHYGDKSARTNVLTLSVLSGFFEYCQAKGYIARALTRKRWRPRIPSPLPKYLNSNELARVKLRAEDMPLRDRVLVSCLLSSGCRSSEVSALDVKDVDLGDRTATVVGKGKNRQVHFSEETALLLKEYLSSHPKDEPALFLNKLGERLSSAAIYKITRELGKKAGILKNLSPHCCRHTFASTMFSRGFTLEMIKAEMGCRATIIYPRIPREQR
jgi:integrase/recombinase XerD